jgi:uncharacterized protein (TIGR02001 family)
VPTPTAAPPRVPAHAPAPPYLRPGACPASLARLLAGLLALSAMPATAREIQAHVSASSDYVVRGVSRSQGDPTLQAQVGTSFGAGGSAGVWFSTMNLNPGRGPNRELGLYLAHARSLDRDWALSGMLVAYRYAAQIPGLDYDYVEARVDLSWRERLQLSVAVSPDYSLGTRLGVARDSTTIDCTLTLVQPLSNAVTLSAGIGQFDLSDGLGLRYAYWSAGALYTGRRLSLALTYTGAEPVTRKMFNDVATGDRLIGTISWRLH